MTDDTSPFRPTKSFVAPPKPAAAAIPVIKPNSAAAYYPNYAQTEAQLAFLQLQATHVRALSLSPSLPSLTHRFTLQY